MAGIDIQQEPLCQTCAEDEGTSLSSGTEGSWIIISSHLTSPERSYTTHRVPIASAFQWELEIDLIQIFGVLAIFAIDPWRQVSVRQFTKQTEYDQ